MLNFKQPRIFYFAAKHLSFTEAARRLYITQPAVTAQVKHLEEHCNFKLFRKRGRRICLTEPREALFEYVKRVFEYEREIEEAIEELRELRNEVAVIVQAGGDHPDVLFAPFSHEEMVVILPPSHALARRRRLSPAEVAAQPIIMKEAGSGIRKVVNEFFEKAGLAPEVLMETSTSPLRPAPSWTYWQGSSPQARPMWESAPLWPGSSRATAASPEGPLGSILREPALRAPRSSRGRTLGPW